MNPDFNMFRLITVNAVMTPEQQLISHILINHTSDGRPVNNPEDTINVTLEFFLSELISVVICIT